MCRKNENKENEAGNGHLKNEFPFSRTFDVPLSTCGMTNKDYFPSASLFTNLDEASSLEFIREPALTN